MSAVTMVKSLQEVVAFLSVKYGFNATEALACLKIEEPAAPKPRVKRCCAKKQACACGRNLNLWKPVMKELLKAKLPKRWAKEKVKAAKLAKKEAAKAAKLAKKAAPVDRSKLAQKAAPVALPLDAEETTSAFDAAVSGLSGKRKVVPTQVKIGNQYVKRQNLYDMDTGENSAFKLDDAYDHAFAPQERATHTAPRPLAAANSSGRPQPQPCLQSEAEKRRLANNEALRRDACALVRLSLIHI